MGGEFGIREKVVPWNVGYGSRTYGKARIVVKDRKLAVVETREERIDFVHSEMSRARGIIKIVPVALGDISALERIPRHELSEPPQLIRVVDFALSTAINEKENCWWQTGIEG